MRFLTKVKLLVTTFLALIVLLCLTLIRICNLNDGTKCHSHRVENQVQVHIFGGFYSRNLQLSPVSSSSNNLSGGNIGDDEAQHFIRMATDTNIDFPQLPREDLGLQSSPGSTDYSKTDTSTSDLPEKRFHIAQKNTSSGFNQSSISIMDGKINAISNDMNNKYNALSNFTFSVSHLKVPTNQKSEYLLQTETEDPFQKALHKIRLDVTNDLKFILKGPPLTETKHNKSKTVSMVMSDITTTDEVSIHRNFLKAFINNLETSSYKNHAMNAGVSRNQSLIREIKDTRSPVCIAKYGDDYYKYRLHEHSDNRKTVSEKHDNFQHNKNIAVTKWSFHKVSIVIPFHNEEYSIFLRGLHSIYQRTPQYLLHEVILIDDSSTFENLKEPFVNYVEYYFPNLKLVRTIKRQGLIRSRLLGAMIATGDVLVFLDAHIECQKHWLEPLLDIINEYPQSIAIPTVDYINPNTVSYNIWSRKQYGTLSWELDYVWKDIPPHELPQDGVSPINSATMIGCAMAINKETFFNIGAYDEDMWIWGGENLELSFRAWMCAGGIKLSPCSHVGHLFRSYLPYSFPSGGVRIHKNLQRVAETWMDDYKKYYYASTSQSLWLSQDEKKTLEWRKKFIHSHLNCKSFEWYLGNIASGLLVPPVEATMFGQIRNVGTFRCFYYSEIGLEIQECGTHSANQIFYYKESTFQLIHLITNQCLSAISIVDNKITMGQCDESRTEQKWVFDTTAPKAIKSRIQGVDCKKPMGRLQLKDQTRCITMGIGGPLGECNYDVTQFWIFTYKLKYFPSSSH